MERSMMSDDAIATTADEAEDLPLVVSYGGGVDSTAMLVGLWREGIRPDVILFANVGSELPDTYDFLPIFDRWLESVGFPRLTIVRNRSPRAGHASLEQNCLENETLPSQAFRGGQTGGGACSSKWKHEPMDRWLLANRIEERQRAVGFDAGPRDSKRAAKGSDEARKHRRDRFTYFLQAWRWDRERCELEIARAGLPVPGKSSCFFCPAMTKDEIRAMARKYPNLLRRAIRIEQVALGGKHTQRRLAEGKTVSVVGLGRRWSWEAWAKEEKLLPEYGGAPDAADARDDMLPETCAWLESREVLA
jgi:hypothetical protein